MMLGVLSVFEYTGIHLEEEGGGGIIATHTSWMSCAVVHFGLDLSFGYFYLPIVRYLCIHGRTF